MKKVREQDNSIVFLGTERLRRNAQNELAEELNCFMEDCKDQISMNLNSTKKKFLLISFLWPIFYSILLIGIYHLYNFKEASYNDKEIEYWSEIPVETSLVVQEISTVFGDPIDLGRPIEFELDESTERSQRRLLDSYVPKNIPSSVKIMLDPRVYDDFCSEATFENNEEEEDPFLHFEEK